MSTAETPAWITKALYAIGIAGVLGGGTTLLANNKEIAVLKEGQGRIEATVEKRLDRIENKIDVLVQESRQ